MKKLNKKSTPAPTARSPLRIAMEPLDSLKVAKGNPKKHHEGIVGSIQRFGYANPIILDERTGRMVAGHGRLEALLQLKASGQAPPEGVEEKGGRWLVPVQRGWGSKNDIEAKAFLVADNQLTISGGWDHEGLEKILAELSDANALDSLGFSAAELEELLRNDDEGVGLYSSKIEGPVYKVTGEKPKVGALCDTTKLDALLEDIQEAEGVPEPVRAFLELAAHRHVVFDYQGIAEFYAHAEAPTQRLMERSALVIIDFKQAIENGFVKLSEGLAAEMVTE